MRKRLAVLVATIASMILIACILFTSLQLTMNNEALITYEYQRLSLGKSMGMNNGDIAASCMRLIDYMEGNVPNIDITVTVNGEQTLMFTDEQEITHMADVKLLYQRFRTFRDIGVFAALLLYLIAALLSFRRAAHTLASGYCWGAFVIALFVCFFGTWALLDFSSFWTFFHRMLFWNDDWLFDPNTSRMINMMPEKFFSDIILVFAVLAAVVIVLLLIIALSALSRERKKAEAAKERFIQKKQALAAKKKAAALKAQQAAEDETPLPDTEQGVNGGANQ